MRSPVANLLRKGGLAPHFLVGRLLHVGFDHQTWILTGLWAVALFSSAWFSGCLYLPGRSIGFVEHPVVWVFLTMQVVLPLAIRGSIIRLARSRRTPFDQSFLRHLLPKVHAFVGLKTAEGRGWATVFYLAGLVNFIWNTYQNQQPGRLLPYDFWDSTTFPVCFWLTRFYKFYLFVWLLPYVALVHTGIVLSVLRSIRSARVSGRLELAPFHPDGVGGLGFAPDLISRPLVSSLLVAGVGTLGAFLVHRSLDVTPVLGAIAVVASVLVAYGLPIARLRRDLMALKKRSIAVLRLKQQEQYSRAIGSLSSGADDLGQANETIEYLDRLCDRIGTISHYPHLRWVLGSATVALLPTLFSGFLRIVEVVNPLLDRLQQSTGS
ncbi:MAG TPA: hypothetical protein VN700_01635 [Vicinamibacterales bacterium]|nr:hypothetical protein [Vicinamibacterales bacterium]